ncbi:MAG: hypothetical protein Q8P18_16285 [Pseudomonadota bacterium]|nr:hypothetical protein [Pseudomonadota bacterium]
MERLILTVRTRADLEAASATIRGMVYGNEPQRPVRVVLENAAALPETVTWGNGLDDTPLDIELDGRGATLRRTSFHIMGSRVSVAHLRLDAGGRKTVLLTISATESIDLADLRLSGSSERPTNRGARVAVGAADLQASGPAVRVTATEVHVLDARGAGAVSLSNQGGSAFSSVTWTNGRFGGCLGPELSLARVVTFAAPGTIRLGAGPFMDALPQTVVLDEGELRPPDDVLLARWRGE